MTKPSDHSADNKNVFQREFIGTEAAVDIGDDYISIKDRTEGRMLVYYARHEMEDPEIVRFIVRDVALALTNVPKLREMYPSPKAKMYSVVIKEVHESYREVEAHSPEEAVQIAMDDAGTEVALRYQRTLSDLDDIEVHPISESEFP
jgi:hypothetical protein